MKLTLDPLAGRPAYQQIEAQVIAQIEAGTLGPGDRLPPERELAASLGVSRMTIRQAFDALARGGLVERGVGRGTFVAAPRVELDRSSRVAGFSEQMERAGLEPGATVLGAEVTRAPAPVARALGLETGARVARVRRVRSGGGMPLTLEDSWLPDALFPGVTDLDLGASLYAIMGARYGHAPVRAVERLEPVAARAQDAEALGVRARTPLMRVERVAYDAEGNAVEYAEDRHRGDRARFVVEVARVDDLAGILAELEPGLGPLAGEPEVLSGGITNHNLKARLGERDYVLRICGKDTEVLSIDRETEVAATRAAHAAGVAPEVVRWLPEHGCLVTAFIPGRPMLPQELRDPQALAQVAAALRAIHAGPPLDRRFPTFTLADEYAATVRERGGEPPADELALARDLSARIGAALRGHELVPRDNDLLGEQTSFSVGTAGSG